MSKEFILSFVYCLGKGFALKENQTPKSIVVHLVLFLTTILLRYELVLRISVKVRRYVNVNSTLDNANTDASDLERRVIGKEACG